jgi:hypothetical protein
MLLGGNVTKTVSGAGQAWGVIGVALSGAQPGASAAATYHRQSSSVGS